MKRFAYILGLAASIGCGDNTNKPVETCTGDRCDCVANPLGTTELYLRGTFNSWGADAAYKFTYDCKQFVLVTEIDGSINFKIADANWSMGKIFGGRTGYAAIEEGGATQLESPGADLSLIATGEMTFALDVSSSGGATLRVTTGAAGGPNIADNPTAQSIHFDSRDLAFKTPFGAIVPGTDVEFTVAAQVNGLTALDLHIEKQNLVGNQEAIRYEPVSVVAMTKAGLAGDGKQLWRGKFTFPDVAIYGYYFSTQIAGATVLYGNNKTPVPNTLPIGAGGVGKAEYKPKSDRSIRRFRQTVYAASFKTPEWVKDAVFYYIFPERFRNGDSSNDPTPGVDHYIGTLPVELHAQWNDFGPYFPGKDVDRSEADDGEYNNDFYGGDLQGITQKLDYIKDLGATAIYANPIFTSPSNHKYDTSDYMNVDPKFGGNAAFTELAAQSADRGMQLLLDTSLNHCGVDSIYFDRYAKHTSVGAFEGSTITTASPFYPWFEFNPDAANPDQKYNSWVGVTSLPNLLESDSYKQFAFRAADSVTRTWLQRGADGWRMDVAPWVSDEFWREWRTVVKAENPEALTLAETWFDSSKYFLGDMFDSTMNYIFKDAVLDYARGGDARKMWNILEMMREHYPTEAFQSLMTLLSTHDAPRALYVFGYDVGEPSAAVVTRAKQRLLLAMLFQMTYPGAPAVFYGDEVGLTGGADPMNRRVYPWADLGGNPDLVLFGEIRLLIRMRNNLAVLRRGTIETLHVDENTVVMLRRHGAAVAIVAVNNAEREVRLTVDLRGAVLPALVDPLRGFTPPVPHDGKIDLVLPATGGVIYATP